MKMGNHYLKLVTIFLIAFACVALRTTQIYAQTMPAGRQAVPAGKQTPNNIFGMHLAGTSDQDFSDVSALVNSNGGNWGYVTIVIQETDRDKIRWQNIFDKLRRHHLIPIIRLATRPQGAIWKRPNKEDAQGWADFLDSLNWVIKDRYVILFNEPNHGQEWGGEADPITYAQITDEFAQKLKQKSPDFKIILAGLDASAPQSLPEYSDELIFLRSMLKEKPDLFNFIDGWSSHSYPNPGFSGSPYAKGRISVFGYDWELSTLRSLGVSKDLPVFITETGWLHDSGTSITGNLSVDQVAQDYKTFFSQVIVDPRVYAVTPFVLDYQADPFSHFSWKKLNASGFYPQYYTVQDMEKVSGKPEQIVKVNTVAELPQFLLEDSQYKIHISIKNMGQAILNSSEGFHIGISTSSATMVATFSTFNGLEPGVTGTVDMFLKTKGLVGPENARLALYKDDTKLMDLFTWNFEVKPKPNIKFRALLFPKIISTDNNYEIQIFDTNEELVYKQNKIPVVDNKGVVLGASNVILDKRYRVVILKPYYLPRQELVTVREGDNPTNFTIMLPVDFNKDGKFSIEDLGALAMRPYLLGLWWPL